MKYDINFNKEYRPGWPIYLWPVLYVRYTPDSFKGRKWQKKSCGLGCYWLSWHWTIYLYDYNNPKI